MTDKQNDEDSKLAMISRQIKDLAGAVKSLQETLEDHILTTEGDYEEIMTKLVNLSLPGGDYEEDYL
jgi:hypothetical protein